MARERSWAARYGAAGESAAWGAVLEHYYWDRLDEAYLRAVELGAGSFGHGLVTFRMIEGEHMTRARGAITKVSEWLSVEWIPEEVNVLQSSDFDYLGCGGTARSFDDRRIERMVDACNQVAWRFGFEHGPPVLVSVLSRDSDVPWMPGRYGYCTDKYPYDKVCIPHRSLHDYDDLEHVVLHEYAHVASLNLSAGRCPLWLDEAMAMVSGGGVDRRAWRDLASGVEPWLGVEELDSAYHEDREDREGQRAVWMAYQQSSVLGYYLAEQKGEKSLGDLMRAMTNNTTMQELVIRFKGHGLTDEALGEVYGFGTRELFARAFDWLGGRE